jgi:cyclopropane-fatty-acyl-phospholipid synthase
MERIMTIQPAKTADHATQTTLSLLQDLFGSSQEHNFAVRLWDGTTWKPEPGNKEPPRFTLVLQHPGAIRSMFLPPSELNLFEAYIFNNFDVEGDIESLFEMLDQLIDERERIGKLEQLRYGKRLKSLPKTDQPRPNDLAVRLRGVRHSKERDRQAVNYHYEQYKQSNDFFALWLDRSMLYTCAYFATPNDDLDAAQERKLDYICRKLRLRPGERLLDIGCGWGGLLIYAAQHYGVEAHGITLGHHQAEFARRRIQEEGLTERCRVEVCDYRDINEADAFDKIVSVGMFELVGEEQLPTYFKQAWRLLRPGGIFLNHGIAGPSTTIALDESNFFGRYVFPDGEIVPISRVLQAAEMSDFEVRDVESLRDHYPLTLRHWVRRLEAHADEARNLTSDVTYRIWRLYMAAFAHGFEIGRITIYQTLLAKPDQGDSRLPLTRADWYA